MTMKISTAATLGLLAAVALGVAAGPASALPVARITFADPSSDLDQVRYGFHHHHGYHHGYRFHHRHGFYHRGYGFHHPHGFYHRHHGLPGHPIRRLLHRL